MTGGRSTPSEPVCHLTQYPVCIRACELCWKKFDLILDIEILQRLHALDINSL